MAKSWSKQEVTYLKRYASKRSMHELAKRFATDETAVARKLRELGLTAKGGVDQPPRQTDPLVKIFAKGVRELYKKNWREAEKLFARVVEETDQVDLAHRARRNAQICAGKLAKKKASDLDDPYLLAVFERNRGRYQEALAVCALGGRQSKDERFAFLAASIHAVNEDFEKAAGFLERAIELDPKNRLHARLDSDFDGLREDPQYAGLFD